VDGLLDGEGRGTDWILGLKIAFSGAEIKRQTGKSLADTSPPACLIRGPSGNLAFCTEAVAEKKPRSML